MPFEKNKWNESLDGSKMKVTDTDKTGSQDQLKTERISADSDKGRHDHDIVKVDKPSGTVKEITVGENTERSREKK